MNKLILLAALLVVLAPSAVQAKEDGPRGKVSSTTLEARADARFDDAKDRAEREIERRIQALNTLMDRINAMKRVSDDDKSSITADITAQITALTTLKGEIENETEVEHLKTSIQSITKSYRIFALVIPVGKITAAADRIKTAASTTSAFADKLEARINASTGDTAPLLTLLADMRAKAADATTQAQVAVTIVAALNPDNGDQSVMKSNQAALKDARTKIETALKDLKTAREDARQIIKALRGSDDSSRKSASTTVETN